MVNFSFEAWRDVPGTPYYISSCGRVFSKKKNDFLKPEYVKKTNTYNYIIYIGQDKRKKHISVARLLEKYWPEFDYSEYPFDPMWYTTATQLNFEKVNFNFASKIEYDRFDPFMKICDTPGCASCLDANFCPVV